MKTYKVSERALRRNIISIGTHAKEFHLVPLVVYRRARQPGGEDPHVLT